MSNYAKNFYGSQSSPNVTQSIPDYPSSAELLAAYNNFASIDWAGGSFVTKQSTSNGQSFVAVSVSPLTTGESQLVQDVPFSLPAALEFEGSIVRNKAVVPSVSAFENASSGAATISPINILSIYQSSADLGVAYNATAGTIVTIVLETALPDASSATPVFLSDWVHVTGIVDSRLNYYNLAIKYISPDRKTITCGFSDEAALPSLAIPAIAPTLGTAKVYFYNNTAGAYNATGFRFSGTTATSAVLFSQFGGGDVQVTGTLLGDQRTTISTTAPNYVNSVYGEYELKASSRFKIEIRPDEVSWSDKTVDSVGVAWTPRLSRTAVKPAVQAVLRPRFRIHSPVSMSRPIAKIVSISKAGTTTTTINTDVAHGLTTGNYITIKGVKDQTNFAAITTPTQVTVTSATQFTIVHGSAVTATSYGGSVILCNGSQDQGGIIGQTVQSAVAYAGNTSWLQLTGSAAWSGINIGDYVELHGCRIDTTGVDSGLDGAWEVAYLSTTTLLLKPITSIVGTRISPTFSTSLNIACGGSLILRTTLRSHDLMLKEFSEYQVMIDGQGSTRVDKAIPVNMVTTGTITGTVQGTVASGATAATNPVGIGGLAQTSNPTAVTSGQAVRTLHTALGAVVNKPFSIPELDWSYTGIITTTTQTAMKAAAGAGVKNYLTGIQLQNTSATATTVIVQDGSTTKWQVSLPASMATPVDYLFLSPIQTTGNAALNITMGAVANVYVNAQGYAAV